MPWTCAGLPSAPADQQPVSSTHCTGAEVLARTPYSMRYDAPSPPYAGGEWPSASVRTERKGSIRFENPAPLASCSIGMSGKTEVTWSLQTISSVATSHTKAAWPSEARMAEAGGGTDVKFASFWDKVLRDSQASNIGPLSA